MTKPKTREEKIALIKGLAETLNSTQLRKKIREVFKVGKSQGNDIYRQIFLASKGMLPLVENIMSEESRAKMLKAACFKAQGDKGVAEIKGHVIYTVEQLIEVCQIDMEQWTLKRFTANSYGDNFQAKGEFERKKDNVVKKLIEDIKADLLGKTTTVRRVPAAPVQGEYLLEALLYDAHFGKLAHAESAGQNYDLKIAKERFMDAVHEIVQKAQSVGKIKRIVFPIGQDFLHIDSDANTTHAGTPQDVDSRFYKIFREGRKLLVEAIDTLATIAPVDVLVIPGNHDTTSMFHLGDAVECWYHDNDKVNIDNAASLRKYYRFGKNLLCYTHGDKEKHDKLPLIAATERPQDWAECTTREWKVGHLHHEIVKEHAGCKIRVVNALSANDSYHYNHGYIGSLQQAQGYLYSVNDGLAAIVYSTPANGKG